jgi:hypothetical protein
MWRLLLGFASGIYVGTYYDCKPTLINIEKNIRDYMPSKKNKN